MSTHADQLEAMFESLPAPVRWHRPTAAPREMIVETRLSSMIFFFDSAGTLVKIETPSDNRAKLEKELRPKVEADLRVAIEEEVRVKMHERIQRTTELIGNARRLVLSREARDSLDAALEKLGEFASSGDGT